MYSLIIVDDEQISREGLAKVVNWEELGFELTGTFDDGFSAIEFIKENEVDVIFTDIKMKKASGIEVAKAVFDLDKQTKVIFMSAYKDFEYARQAITFNVGDYLLKPISMDEVKKTFANLKIELDEIAKKRQSEIQDLKESEERTKELQIQFFANIVMGAFKDKKYLENCFSKLNLPFDFDESSCCVLEVNIENYHDFLENEFDYGKDGLNMSVDNFYSLEDENMHIYPITHKEESVRFVFVSKDKINKEDFIIKVKERSDLIKSQMISLMNLSTSYRIISSYNSILELAIYNVSFSSNEIIEKGMREDNQEINTLIRQWLKTLLTSLLSVDREMVYNIIEQFINIIKPLDIGRAKVFIIDFIAVLKYQLNENDINVEDVHYQEAILVKDLVILEKWLREYIDRALCIIEKSSKHQNLDSSKNFAKRAKQYICSHLNDDLSLENIADYLFISPVYFSRLFKEQTNENYIDYVISKRIESAMELLENTDKKIYEICYSVGYSNVRYFYKLFKKQTGQTPTEFRCKKRGR